MFQTIGHKTGFVQVSTFGNLSSIEAWCHGDNLGKYKSISAAKRAITLSHKKWINKRQNDHQVYIQSIVRTD